MASRLRVQVNIAQTLYEFKWLFVNTIKRKDVDLHALFDSFSSKSDARHICKKITRTRKSDVEKCTRRRIGKVELEEKKNAIKLMIRMKKASYLLKHMAVTRRGEKGRFTRVKKLPARHRAISVAWRERWLILSRRDSRRNPQQRRTVRRFSRSQIDSDTLGHALHLQLPGTRRV